jgi:hypothetical protein
MPHGARAAVYARRVTATEVRPVARPRERAAATGTTVVLLLVVAAVAVPRLLDWEVNADDFPPLDSLWHPRIGPGTLPAAVLAVAAVGYAARLAQQLSWPRLLAAAVVMDGCWLTSLALVDGLAGIGDVLGRGNEYLIDARSTTDISAAVGGFVARIPLDSTDNWHTHVAGHPPGALLFFTALVRLGLGGGLTAGFAVIAIAATTPAAVLLTLQRLGAEPEARLVAPFLVFGPAAIWTAVSADAVFTACGAWALYCLAVAATTPTPGRRAVWASVAGLVLGACLMLSYGLPLLALLGLAVLLAAGTLRPLTWAVAGACVVVLGFAVAGFSWWEAYPVLRERYYAGIAGTRPAGYWVWGDLAALTISAGPLLGPAVAATLTRLRAVRRGLVRGPERTLMLLVGAAALCVALADLSFMSKAETERIWLPFVPWLLVGCALLPERWRRGGLAAQVVVALAVQTLLYTRW